MGCQALNNRLVDSVTDFSPFGPTLRDELEGWELIAHVWRTRAVDPRHLDFVQLSHALSEVRAGVASSMPTHPDRLCACRSGLPFDARIWLQDGQECRRCADCDDWTAFDPAVASPGAPS